jgi:hypothetical protein
VTLAATLTYDAGSVVFDATGGFAEATAYNPGGGALPVRASALWGEPYPPADAGYGVLVLQREVWLLSSQLVDAHGTAQQPAAGQTLTRFPDAWSTQADQEWMIVAAHQETDTWRLTVQRGVQ